MNPDDRKELLQRFLQQACLVVESPIRSECVAIYNEATPQQRLRCLWGDVGNRDKVTYEGVESLDELASSADLSSVVVLARFNFENKDPIPRGEEALESVMKLWEIPACPSGIWRSLGGGLWGLPTLRRWTSGMVNLDSSSSAYARLVSLYFGGTMAMAINLADRGVFRMWVGPEAAYDASVQKLMELIVGNTELVQSHLRQVMGAYRDRAWIVRPDDSSDRKWSMFHAPAESVSEWKRIVDSCRPAGFPVDMIWRNGK